MTFYIAKSRKCKIVAKSVGLSPFEPYLENWLPNNIFDQRFCSVIFTKYGSVGDNLAFSGFGNIKCHETLKLRCYIQRYGVKYSKSAPKEARNSHFPMIKKNTSSSFAQSGQVLLAIPTCCFLCFVCAFSCFVQFLKILLLG